MLRLGKIFVAVGILDFIFVSLLLFTNHSGFALKVTNFNFGMIFVGTLLVLNGNEKE